MTTHKVLYESHILIGQVEGYNAEEIWQKISELNNLPKDRKNEGCKWMFRTKRDVSVESVTFITWLVEKRHSQMVGVDPNRYLSLCLDLSSLDAFSH